MPTYLIGYDIQPKQDETYADLTGTIKRLGPWWHPRESTWVVVTDKSAVQIRDALAPHLQRDDQLLVVREDRDVAWAGFGETANDWPSQAVRGRCDFGARLADLIDPERPLSAQDAVFAEDRARMSRCC